MHNLVRKNIYKINPYVPGKPIDEVARELGLTDICKLASNENPLGPSRKAMQVIKKQANKIFLYPESSCFYLKKKLAEKFGFSEHHFIFGNGSNDLIELVAKTLLHHDDEVIIAKNSFVVYGIVSALMNVTLVEVPLKNFTHDLEAIANHISARTKLIMLCNPNNPTGTMFTQDEFDRFMQKVPDNVFVMMDEAYAEYVENKEYPDSFKYLKQGKKIIILRTFSKIYGLAGLRIGYALTLPGLVENMNKIRQPFNVNFLAQVAASAALDDEAHILKTRKNNTRGLKYFEKSLKAMKVGFVPSVANFIMVDVGDKVEEVFKKLMLSGVIVRPMKEPGISQFIRVSIGLPKENKRFIESLEGIVGQRVKKKC